MAHGFDAELITMQRQVLTLSCGGRRQWARGPRGAEGKVTLSARRKLDRQPRFAARSGRCTE